MYILLGRCDGGQKDCVSLFSVESMIRSLPDSVKLRKTCGSNNTMEAGDYPPMFFWPPCSLEAGRLQFASECGHGLAAMAFLPQVQWWLNRAKQWNGTGTCGGKRVAATRTLTPSNLTRSRYTAKKCHLQVAVKYREDKKFPVVTVPLRPPADMVIAFALSEVAESTEVAELLAKSFCQALEAVTAAAKAFEELSKKTKWLLQECQDEQVKEKVKQAKIRARDVVLWRWFALTGWMYNEAEADVFQTYGKEIQSQLVNGVAKIRQNILQNMMRRPAWAILERKLVDCTLSDAWPRELSGIMSRLYYTVSLLTRNVGRDEVVSKELLLKKMAMTSEEAAGALQNHEDMALIEKHEKDFEDQVWHHAASELSRSLVLGLLDDEVRPSE